MSNPTAEPRVYRWFAYLPMIVVLPIIAVTTVVAFVFLPPRWWPEWMEWDSE